MIANNIFRLALVLNTDQANSFKTNLKKLVKLVLYDSFEKPLKLSQIKKTIKDQFSLEFTDNELSGVLNGDDSFKVVENSDSIENTYELTLAEFKKLQSKQELNIDDYIQDFLKSDASEDSWEFDSTKKLVYDFLYYSFNSDAQTVLELMNTRKKTPTNFCVNTEFDSEQAKIINAFINWDYAPKNEFVMKLISACFDYCMLTVKKDSNSYSNIFKGKEFYLDSNIIFRLAGFNKADRKASIEAFIAKCIDAEIKICYTNHTSAEIKNTLKHYVDSLKGVLGLQEPISTEAMASLDSKYANLDFYDKYVEWCKSKTNKLGDYKSFQKHLERIVEDVLRPFHLVAFDTYDTIRNQKRFKHLCTEFTAYKIKNERKTHESSIKTDINNYIYISEKAAVTDESNFMQLKYYFITADHSLTEWTVINRPGVVPLFVLPSVWYSILLKYKGRTAEDYYAFCQFLNIRISPEQDDTLEQKQEMLAYILKLDEDKNIKESIISDINSRLCEPDVVIEDPIAFVKQSHDTITNQHVERALKESENQHAKALKDSLRQKDDTHKAELNSLEKANKIQLKEEKNKSYNDGQDFIIKKQAQGIIKRNRAIKCFGYIILILAILSVLLALLNHLFIGINSWIDQIIKFYESNETILAFISALVTALSGIFLRIMPKIDILSADINTVIKRLNRKYKTK